MSLPQDDLWVFRDGRKTVSTKAAIDELQSCVARFLMTRRQDDWLNALIRAGQFESAVADAKPRAAVQSADVTDAIAGAFYAGYACDKDKAQLASIAEKLETWCLPHTVEVSTAEGFAYYALHPLDFAEAARKTTLSSKIVFVIGIRSIGTTLSSVALAALKKDGHRCERITVRPAGAPYNRVTELNSEQIRLIEKYQDTGATFLVVDEGPGRSGSSFLSVAEALTACGVESQQIILLGTNQPDVEQLRAHDAANRWKNFRFVAAESPPKRFHDCVDISGGEWRRVLLNKHTDWPETWRQMERLKFLSADKNHLFKFEGLGPFGEAALERAKCLAKAGFSGAVENAGDGFLSYPLVAGEALNAADISTSFLDHLARYCAFRWRTFRTPEQPSESLSDMLRANLQKEFGIEWVGDFEHLKSENPIVTDGRMQPYEWIRARDGSIIKTDATSHGDDHFFPGPCDVAWDVAGCIVEWDMPHHGTEYLLRGFHQLTGNDLRSRISEFVLAYTMFRVGYCKMATGSECDAEERSRLERAYQRYRRLAQDEIEALRPQITMGETSSQAEQRWPE